MHKMKFVVLVFAMIAGLGSINGQAKTKWPEMEEFHKVMSQTFHPAEEGRLEPIRTRSGEMLEKAIAWKKSDTPAGYNKKALKKPLKKLVRGARELNDMVKDNGSDNAITSKLTSLHDVFHEIMDKRSAH